MQTKIAKHYWSLFLAAGLLLWGDQVLAAKPVGLDKVVAIVDEDVVLQSELNERTQAVLQRLQGQYSQLPPEDVLRKQVLDQLILERIELGLAKRYEIKVEESEVDQAVERVRDKNKMTQEQLLADLKRQGLNIEGLRAQILNELILSHLQQGVVLSLIHI